MLDEKIIQIMPAPSDLYAIFKNSYGNVHSKIICIALTNEGNVQLLDVDEMGFVSDVSECSNFDGVIRIGERL